MSKDVARTSHLITNARTGFVALRKPYEGKHGASYTLGLVFDLSKEEENKEVLTYIAKVLTKGGPVDEKDGLVSTGRIKLNFSSKDRPIPVFDARGIEIPQEEIPTLGADSIVNVKFHVVQTKMGVFKYIDGVQIVEVKEYVAVKPKIDFAPVAGFEHKDEIKKPKEKKLDFESLF